MRLVKSLTSGAASLAMLVATLPASVALAPVAHATGSTTNYSACSDSYVDHGNPTTNYGSGTELNTNTDDPEFQNSLIKFCSISVPSNVHVSSATLTFDAQDCGGTGATNGVELKRVPRSSNWTESGVTWNNQPTPYSSYAKHVEWTVGTCATYYSRAFDVTQLVQMTNTTGDYAFQLSSDYNSGGADSQVIFRSREASTNQPVLTVTTADDTAPTVSNAYSNWSSASPAGEIVGATVNPNGSLTHAIAQIADDSAFTTNVSCLPSCTVGSGTDLDQQPLDKAFSQKFTSLPSGHTYYARVVAQNYKGTTYSSTVTFTTP